MTAETLDAPQYRRRPADMGTLLRAALAVAGTGMSLAAFALWVMPGTSNLPELTLIKLGLSLFLLIGGLSCLTGSRRARR
ncbi:hypothetical protein [Salipiger sp.]|uniref:hypothetical protein n=1 Tax=Salipiger sp. TaxID=2078585 RepID=UPI003A9805B7